MKYPEPIARAVEHIEAHLKEPLSLDAIARVAGYSPFHFHRLFLAVVGETPASFIRGRRLAESARELSQPGKRILDVALEYQYDSPESFARAFRKRFGVPPGQYRGGAMSVKEGMPMEPRIVERSAFQVAGMIYFGENKHGEIGQLWTRFNQKAPQIRGRIDGAAYGICFTDDRENPNFWYLASLAVESLESIPMEMVAKTIPAHTYAVFTHRGPVSRIPETYQYAYGTWLPGSGYEPADVFDFEYYDERFTGPEAEDSEVDIYIPVRRA